MSVLHLDYQRPIRFAAIEKFLSARAIAGIESFEPGRYARIVDGHTVVVATDGEELTITVPRALKSRTADLVARARRVFDLDADPATIDAHLRRDPLLRPLIRRRPGARVPGAWEPFETAVRAIVGQQISVAGATTIMQRLAGVLTPQQLAIAEITGMPASRAESIRQLSRAVAGDPTLLSRASSLEESLARLTALPGIGPWTANYVAMRVLREPDAFPASDLGLRKAAANAGIDDLVERAERWRPWRSYAAIVLWESL